MSGFLLTLLVFLPFLGGLFVWLAKDERVSESINAGIKAGMKAGSRAGIKAVIDPETDFREWRDRLPEAVVILEFVLMLCLMLLYGRGTGAVTLPGICGMGLSLTLDGFRLLYGMIASFMWMMATLLCREYFRGHENQTRFLVFFLLTLGATMGVFLSADLYTTFVFFEMMSFTSYVWVAQEEDAPSLRAAETYLAVAVIGGLVMLMGLFLLYHEVGTLRIDELRDAVQAHLADAGDDLNRRKTALYCAGGCMLFGFGAKAGAFPLHIWLPKAHPVAPAPASALLSGILTKTGVFGILAISSTVFLHDASWGGVVLAIGVITMFGGALLAICSLNLKRVLACSSMSQIGFILVGVGMQGLLGEENALAVHGTLLHMMNHSLIKLVLFLAAGVIFMNTHALDLNEIRGYGRRKPMLKACFLVGALAIGGIPFFGGYISKTLLHESIVEYGGGLVMTMAEWIFLISGGLTVAYMTKLYVAIFVEPNDDPERQRKFDTQPSYMNAQSMFALGGSALALFVWGFFPHSLMDRAANLGQSFMGLTEAGETVNYFSGGNLVGGFISIAIGAAVYVLIVRRRMAEREKLGQPSYVDAWPSWLDLEERLYRPLLLKILPAICGTVCSILDGLTDAVTRAAIPVGGVFARIFDSLTDLSVVGLRRSIYRDSPLPHERLEGTVFTAAAGAVMNFIRDIANRTWRRGAPSATDYRHVLAVRYDELREDSEMIGRSLSFALLLFGVGLVLTMVYIILM